MSDLHKLFGEVSSPSVGDRVILNRYREIKNV